MTHLNRYQLIAIIIFAVFALAILCEGCTTAGKATRYFDDHRDTAAGYCAVRYPVKVDSTVEVRVDSAGYKKTVSSLQKFADSSLKAAQARYDANKDDLLRQINTLREKGEYSESVAQQLADEVNRMQPPDTSGLYKAIEARILSTIKPCADTLTWLRQENTARVAAAEAGAAKENARADYNQQQVDEYHAGKKSVGTTAKWLGHALLANIWFWAFVAALVAFVFRGLWLPKIPFLSFLTKNK